MREKTNRTELNLTLPEKVARKLEDEDRRRVRHLTEWRRESNSEVEWTLTASRVTVRNECRVGTREVVDSTPAGIAPALTLRLHWLPFSFKTLFRTRVFGYRAQEGRTNSLSYWG